MEEIRKAMSPMDLKTIKNSLQRSGKFSKEIIELICDDLNFGLTKAETEQYSLKNFDITQMRVYSNCLRKGYNNEVIDVITEEGLDGHQMEVAFEFYEKGIPLSTIKEITARKENTAYMMKQMLLEAVSKTQEVILNESSNNKEFTEQIQKVFDKAVQSIQKDIQEQKDILSQLIEKDTFLELQQDKLNEAIAMIAKLKEEKKQLENERKEIEQDTKYQEKNIVNTEDLEKLKQQKARIPPYIKRECQIEDIKENKKKKHKVFSLFSSSKKRDMVRLLAKKDLLPEQLVQIRSAIEKGLTEQQILVLINKNIPANQMEEIIQIAAFENSQS